MNPSKIEWTEATWSPVIGCTKVSAGCKHCYAEREVETRWSKNPKSIWYGRSFTDVLCRPEAIAGAGSPLRWRKPRRIFVCPRADLFHIEVPFDFIADVFGVMAATPQHTYQVLTKRSDRAWWLLARAGSPTFVEVVEECAAMYRDAAVVWPLPNVHLGVSIEDQPSADERIGNLLKTPAAVRWVSAEPLLGAVDLRPYLDGSFSNADISRPDLDWVVVGGESGPDARPMHPDWVRQIRDDCNDTRVPLMFKQWGEWARWSTEFPVRDVIHVSARDGRHGSSPGYVDGDRLPRSDTVPMVRIGKRSAGRLLDGVLHDAYPAEHISW